MDNEVKCQDCRCWPRENGAKGSWRMCRKWFRLMREDWSCEEGEALAEAERADVVIGPYNRRGS